MKTIIFILITLFFSTSSYSSNLRIIETGSGWKTFNGFFSDMEMEITPTGNYAQIDLTFRVCVDSVKMYYYNYQNSLPNYTMNTLEGIFNFTMDTGCIFNNAYLWLNETVIIKAALMEKGKANAIYNSIVIHRKDPLIMNQNSKINYEFKVYPMATNFPRKIKLSYLIPLLSLDKETEIIKLPYEILNKVSGNENIKIVINTNDQYSLQESLPYPSIAPILPYSPGKHLILCPINELLKSNFPYIPIDKNKPTNLSFTYASLDSVTNYYHLKVNTKFFNPQSFIHSGKITIPFQADGFNMVTYNNFENFSTSFQFIESGIYYGKIDPTQPFYFYYTDQNGIHKEPIQVNNLNYQENVKQVWGSIYCEEKNNATAVKYSKQFKFLNMSTAFLALETGDTVNQSNTSETKIISSITDYQLETNLTIGPNPFIDQFTIKSIEPIESIIVLNLNGQSIYEKLDDNNSQEITCDLSSLSLTDGIYIIRVKIKGEWISKKLIKQSFHK